MTTASQPYSAWNVEEYHFPRHGTLSEKLTFLLNYTILAPSLHNTQPWKFTVHDNEIRVLADRTRQLQVADPDARELYISLGCALENLLTAATFFGLRNNVGYFPTPNDELWVATVTLKDVGTTASLADQERFHAITLRHT
ncbi:MAG: nitroreductase, partial [Anaerolineae bacterium]|nr:nitroreductase [Anaerolineae bacterium]